MRALVLWIGIILTVGVLESQAAVPVLDSFPSDLTYTRHLFPSPRDSHSELSALEPGLEKKGFQAFDPQRSGNIPFLWMSQVFERSSDQGVIFLRFDLDLKTEKYLNQLILHPDGWLYHGKTKSGRGYALFFRRIEQAEVMQLVQWFTKTLQRDFAPSRARFSFFPEAHAAPGVYGCASGGAWGSLKTMEQLGQRVEGAGVWDQVSGCFSGLLKGVWEGTGGLVTSVVDGAVTLFTDPAKAWHSVTGLWDSLKSFFSDFMGNMSRMFEKFGSLPPEVKAEMICSFIGNIGVDVALAILTEGAGSAKVAVTMERYLAKLEKVIGFTRLMEKFEKLKSVGQLRELRGKLFTRIVKGMPEQELETIEKFSKMRLSEFAYDAAVCGM